MYIYVHHHHWLSAYRSHHISTRTHTHTRHFREHQSAWRISVRIRIGIATPAPQYTQHSRHAATTYNPQHSTHTANEHEQRDGGFWPAGP